MRFHHGAGGQGDQATRRPGSVLLGLSSCRRWPYALTARCESTLPANLAMATREMAIGATGGSRCNRTTRARDRPARGAMRTHTNSRSSCFQTNDSQRRSGFMVSPASVRAIAARYGCGWCGCGWWRAVARRRCAGRAFEYRLRCAVPRTGRLTYAIALAVEILPQVLAGREPRAAHRYWRCRIATFETRARPTRLDRGDRDRGDPDRRRLVVPRLTGQNADGADRVRRSEDRIDRLAASCWSCTRSSACARARAVDRSRTDTSSPALPRSATSANTQRSARETARRPVPTATAPTA